MKANSEQSQQVLKALDELHKLQHLYHLVRFKNIKQSKITKVQKPVHDFQFQNQQLMVHMLYLVYFAYQYKVDVYVYEDLCQNRWGILFKYYSLEKKHSQFMKKISFQGVFTDSLAECVTFMGKIKSQYNYSQAIIDKISDQDQLEDFLNRLQQKYEKNLQPKQIMHRIEETKFMRDRLYILKVLSSIILPFVRRNQDERFIQPFITSINESQAAIRRIFQNKTINYKLAAQFQERIQNFLARVNPSGFGTSTSNQKKEHQKKSQNSENKKGKQNKVLVAQLKIEVKRNDQQIEIQKSQNKSNHGDDQLDQRKLSMSNRFIKIFVFMKINPVNQSIFLEVSLQFCSKKICQLNYLDVKQIWERISQKWKVLMDKNGTFGQFSPSFIEMNFDKDGIIIKDRINGHPDGHLLTYIVAYIDRLIMVYLILEDVTQIYHSKQASLQFYKQESDRKLQLNEGRIQILALSAYTGLKHYESLLNKIIKQSNEQVQKSKMQYKI